MRLAAATVLVAPWGLGRVVAAGAADGRLRAGGADARGRRRPPRAGLPELARGPRRPGLPARLRPRAGRGARHPLRGQPGADGDALPPVGRGGRFTGAPPPSAAEDGAPAAEAPADFGRGPGAGRAAVRRGECHGRRLGDAGAAQRGRRRGGGGPGVPAARRDRRGGGLRQRLHHRGEPVARPLGPGAGGRDVLVGADNALARGRRPDRGALRGAGRGAAAADLRRGAGRGGAGHDLCRGAAGRVRARTSGASPGSRRRRGRRRSPCAAGRRCRTT